MKDEVVLIFADAAVKPNMTGIGLAIKDARGRLVAWHGKRVGAMTCVEAEYAAVIFALEQALQWNCRAVRIHSDSRVVIEQIQGLMNVRGDALRALRHQATSLAARLPSVKFVHIPRTRNELADAMAEDVCQRMMSG